MSDQKFTVPEPEVSFSEGFLSNYWKQDAALPKFNRLELGIYFLRQGLRTITELPTSNIVTILTFAMSLFILSGSFLILQNVGKIILNAGNSFYLTAYLKDGISDDNLNTFVEKIKEDQRFASVEYTSKEQAMIKFKHDFVESASVLSGLEQDNPLPASLDLVLDQSKLSAQSFEKILAELNSYHDYIEEVAYGNEFLGKVNSLLKIFKVFGVVVLFIIIVVVFSLISNTIKLVFYSRKEEIAIMQLVGASRLYLLAPFIVGGLLQAFLGSFLGLLLLWIVFKIAQTSFSSIGFIAETFPAFSFLSTGTIIIIFFIGLLIGGLSSYFSLEKYMDA